MRADGRDCDDDHGLAGGGVSIFMWVCEHLWPGVIQKGHLMGAMEHPAQDCILAAHYS